MTDIAVYIVTYRRHNMLRRAIASVLAQTLREVRVVVINDDPGDPLVGEIVEGFSDTRLSLHLPLKKRGAAANFNLMFDDSSARFVALLEDDNWWEPDFLATMLILLESHPEIDAACCNEHLWRENTDGSWTDTGKNIWPDFGTRLHTFSLVDLCGSAKLCNSSMLYRRRHGTTLKTPGDIPVDVTEHFRERLFPGGLVLHSRPMVNYAETLGTARGCGSLWGQYQTLLIGSVFAALAGKPERIKLAKDLWASVENPFSPPAVTLVCTGLAIPEARALVMTAPGPALLRASAKIARRFPDFRKTLAARSQYAQHFSFLMRAPLVQRLAGNRM